MAKYTIAILMELLIYVNCNPSPSIIIVGAGSAGIAAASRLVESGFTNINILEAEGRIGGRVNSVSYGEAVVDLGAEWCHGEGDNVVYQMVKDLNLLSKGNWTPNYYHSSQEAINDFSYELVEIIYELYTNSIESDEEISLGDYIIPKYNQTVMKLYGDDPKKLQLASEFLETMAHEILEMEGSFSWFDTAAKSDFDESGGNQLQNWKGRGYKTFLNILMKTYPDPNNQILSNDEISLNKEVTKIRWDGENGVSIECFDNSTYQADYVIFTPSLGVLKNNYETLFHPQLPQEKIDAINELGINAVGKAFLEFPEKWWSWSNEHDVTGATFVWSQKERSELLHTHSDTANEDDQSWLLDLVGLYTVARNPNVLEAWFAGESIPKIESFSDEKIIDGIMFTLNKFLGHEFQNITKPESLLRFNWYSNPHFRGTYSYQTVSSRKREVSGETILSKPLISSNGKPALLFAGEATSPNHYATVHGAVETGFREAERIINLYK